MIIESSLSRHRRVRVWLDEVPFRLSGEGRELGRCYAISNQVEFRGRSAALELFAPKGRLTYGLLGGTLLAGVGDSLEVILSVGNDTVIFEPISGLIADWQPGLPAEYHDAVMRGVSSVQESVPAGRLRLDCAAYSMIASANVVFHELAARLLRLLTSDKDGLDSSDVAALFQN